MTSSLLQSSENDPARKANLFKSQHNVNVQSTYTLNAQFNARGAYFFFMHQERGE